MHPEVYNAGFQHINCKLGHLINLTALYLTLCEETSQMLIYKLGVTVHFANWRLHLLLVRSREERWTPNGAAFTVALIFFQRSNWVNFMELSSLMYKFMVCNSTYFNSKSRQIVVIPNLNFLNVIPIMLWMFHLWQLKLVPSSKIFN